METCLWKNSATDWKPLTLLHVPDMTWSHIIFMASCRVCEIWFRLLAAKQYFQHFPARAHSKFGLGHPGPEQRKISLDNMCADLPCIYRADNFDIR